MRKLLIALLLLNAVCLFAICQPLAVLAGSGSGGGSDPCSADPTKYALDTNGDEVVDLSDFVAGLSWFFSGGTAPRVCLDTTDLEASLAQAEGERDVAQTALGTAEGERDAAQLALGTAEGERDTAQAALETANGQVTTLTGERDALQGQLTETQGLLTAADARIAELEVLGCMDPAASNFDSDANTDDGSCEYPGCTDPDATNYDPGANVDDGSCFFEGDISGFTFVETNTDGYDEYTHDASGIRFVLLPGGSFEMGSPATEPNHQADEGPVHTVSLSPFLIAKYEVTQSEYAAVMTDPPAGLNATPSSATGDNLPVEQVSWDDLKNADGFLARTGLVLPSEAQWEYACRAGTSGPYAGNGNFDDMGWYDGNSGGATHDVGGKQANQFGLHDMHGNVFEWCEDVYDGEFYSSAGAGGPDPSPQSAPSCSGNRVLRGGDFYVGALDARSALRFSIFPTNRFNSIGFRPVYWPLP